MIGAESLIAMRKRGRVPAVVWLDADSGPVPYGDDWTGEDAYRANHAHLWLGSDCPDRVDLRCVVGLTVHVTGAIKEIVHTLRDRCIAAKAHRVVASVLTPRGKDEWIAYHLDECTDTAGQMTWPKS